MSSLLRTGEAAARLGVSRQHVVNLCERGMLPVIRVGTHRRIPESAVTKLTGTGSLTGGALSLWLHAAVVGHLLADSDLVISQAEKNIDRIRSTGSSPRSEAYLVEWERILSSGVAAIVAALLDPTEHGGTLRSCTPFAGVLTQDEVATIKSAWKRFRDSAGDKL